jgi:hypothetical protein
LEQATRPFGLDAVDVRTLAHRALWQSLHSAIHECATAQISPLARPAWRARYQLLAAHLANRLITLDDEEAAQDLRTLLGPLLNLDTTLAEVVGVLLDAGVKPTIIALGSERPAMLVELLRRLEREQTWREAQQKEQLGNQSTFSERIRRMVNAIETSRSGRCTSNSWPTP